MVDRQVLKNKIREKIRQHYWLNLIYSALKHVRDRDVLLIVYGLSFVTLLSFVPFLIIILGFFKTSGFLAFLYPKVEALVVKKFSGVASVEISRQLHSLLKRSYSGSWGFFNITFLLFTTTRLAAFLEKALNRIWNVKNPKNFFRRFLSHWAVITMIPLALAINVLTRSFIWNFVKSPLLLLTMSFIFLAATLFALYKWLPNHSVRTELAAFCGTLAAVSLIGVQNFFDFASAKMFQYSKFYGSLSALPLFMIWISTIWMVILLGASICAGLQKALEQIEDN
ncbi:MAG: ribonuclease [Pseudomonadota bacterium]|jgi:membrane protein